MIASVDRTGVRFVADRPVVAAGLLSAGADLAALLRELPPEAGVLPVPGMAWSVAETAAHVVTVVRRSLGDRRRSASPQGTAPLNAACLDEFGERDLGRLADLLDAEVPVVVHEVLPRFADDVPVAFHGGTRVRLLTAYAVMLADLLVHRWDVAGAVGTPPVLPAAPSLAGLQALLELLPVWVEPDRADDLDLVLDVAEDGPYRFRSRAGLLEVERAGCAGVPGEPVVASDLLLAICGRQRPSAPAVARLCAAVQPI